MVKYAILHEGKNSPKAADNKLIRMLINHLGLPIENVQFYPMGSKSNFFKIDYPAYRGLKQSVEADQIQKVLFILDADSSENDQKYGGYENTLREVTTTIDALNLSHSSDTYISCDPETGIGYLESLILTTIPPHQKECIEQFLTCSDFRDKDNAKAILNQIYNQAYPKPHYNFSHSNFNELKEKITALFSE